MLRTPNGAVALKKEWKQLEKKEYFLWVKACQVADPPSVPIPSKLQMILESGFSRAFSWILLNGTGVLEKTYSKEKLQEDFWNKHQKAREEQTRRAFQRLPKGGRLSHTCHLLFTSAEGIGLGILGIGLPDIVLFLSILLKGIYETALRYGFDYEAPEEKYLILKMMQCALSKQGEWKKGNDAINKLLSKGLPPVTEEELGVQMHAAAQTFALNMLLLKSIQTLPVIGILGGISNPFYYRKIMHYVNLKYYRRYLLQLEKGETSHDICACTNQTGGI